MRSLILAPVGSRKIPATLCLLGASLEFSISLPETYAPPTQPDAATLTAISLILIFSAAMIYANTRMPIVWATLTVVMSLLLIIIGGPLEGLEVLGPPVALTGGLLAVLGQISANDNK